MSSAWETVCRLYAAPGVRGLCLDLQDQHGIDVPVLLTGGWLFTRGVALDAGRWTHLTASAAAWQTQVVAPLRAARRALLQAAPPLGIAEARALALKREVQAVELAAERLQIEALAETAAAWPATVRPPAGNFAALLPTLEATRWVPLVAAVEAACRR
ncbi:MAG: TIGR02444 family protein [Geminicoccaceae bacterium]|nr:MAG: TIGR02444 family protein [Geminicoccaceae bacterium]